MRASDAGKRIGLEGRRGLVGEACDFRFFMLYEARSRYARDGAHSYESSIFFAALMAATSSTADVPPADEEEDFDESHALQIESANPGKPRSGGIFSFLQPRQKTNPFLKPRRGKPTSLLDTVISTVGSDTLLGRCFGLVKGGAPDSAEREDEPLLFALTWAQPQKHGIAPSPRNGHTMVLIGVHLYIFGGGDETVSFNDVHTLHTATITWDRPVVHGQMPSPRSRHSATAVGPNMVVFGGVGGGNELHILETDTLTWYLPKVSGEPPLPRFGHSATLVESAVDQSRKVQHATMCF